MESRRRVKAGGEKKMSLEEYVDFFISANSFDYTVSYLNQIIHMHGFRKLYKFNKKTVAEAVNALDLLDLSRSTLKQNAVSSPSSLTLEEVITDIEALKWQECCLTSLEIINSDEVTRTEAKPKQKLKKRKKTTMKKLLKSGEAKNAGDDNSIVLPLRKNAKSITKTSTLSQV